MTILDLHIQHGSGMIAGPGGLGIFVAPDVSYVHDCPAGWIFVDASDAANWDAEYRQGILNALRDGRTSWPTKETHPKPPRTQQSKKTRN